MSFIQFILIRIFILVSRFQSSIESHPSTLFFYFVLKILSPDYVVFVNEAATPESVVYTVEILLGSVLTPSFILYEIILGKVQSTP